MPSLPMVRGHRRGQSLGAFKKEASVSKFNIEDILAFDKPPSAPSPSSQPSPLTTKGGEDIDSTNISMKKLSIGSEREINTTIYEKPPKSSPQKPPLPKPKSQDPLPSNQNQQPFSPTNTNVTTASPNHPLMRSGFNDQEIITANQKLLNAIANADFATYKEICSPDLTAFEPESNGNLVHGLKFHKYYFDLFGKPAKPVNVTISSPHVRWIGNDGNAAVISYVRLDQVVVDGGPVTRTMSETRVWQKEDGKWINVHFHKS
ncbi:hypothetical protein ACHAXS_011101 [Conticribra weissflogii]